GPAYLQPSRRACAACQWRIPPRAAAQQQARSLRCRPLRLGGRCRPVCGNHLGLGHGRLPEHWSVNELPLSWCGCCSGHEIRTSSNVVKVLQESKSSVSAEALHIPAAALALQGEKEEVRKQL